MTLQLIDYTFRKHIFSSSCWSILNLNFSCLIFLFFAFCGLAFTLLSLSNLKRVVEKNVYKHWKWNEYESNTVKQEIKYRAVGKKDLDVITQGTKLAELPDRENGKEMKLHTHVS